MGTPVEAILAEIGKAFRLCRFYPASHPSVQQALAGISSTLPALANVGIVELRITPTGFVLGTATVAPRNPPVQELAGLLYTQGHRYLRMEPGLTVDQVAALLRAASSGAERAMQAIGGQAAFEQLPHIRLERTRRQTAAAPVVRPSGGATDQPVLGRRTMQVFRPDALPPAIETSRLMAVLADGGAGAVSAAERLGQLAAELAPGRDFKTLAGLVRALGRAARGPDTSLAAAAGRALETVPPGAVAGLVSRLADAALAPEARDEAAQAVASLGARAVALVADAYLVTSRPEERDILLAVVRSAGAAGAEAVLSRVSPDAHGEAALAQAKLLAATGSASSALLLGAFAMHTDPVVREAAVTGLARIDDSEASRVTIGALRDPDARVRAAAARGIGWFGDASSAPILLVRLEAESDEAAASALIGALGELREVRAVPVLVAIARGVSGVFQRHATAVRVAAVRALGVIGTDEAREALRERLGSRAGEVRAAAAQALGTA